MACIEMLKNVEAFLTEQFNLARDEYEKVKEAPLGAHDFPNVRLKTALMLLQAQTFMHRDAIKQLIDAYQRIDELEQQLTKMSLTCNAPAAADDGQK